MNGTGAVAVHGALHVPLLTAAQSAEADLRAREHCGIPERVLMENAGRAAALIVARLFPTGPVVVLTGRGHNGGDGAVLARTLRGWGRNAVLLPADGTPPDAALSHRREVPVLSADDGPAALAGAAVLVDALLGTGARGAARAPADAWIHAMNAAAAPVMALDLPSGVDATTGQVEGAAVRAEVTVSFGWPKLGLLFHPARAHCGRLVAVEIGFPPLDEELIGAELVTPAWAAARLPRRAPDAHKGSAGRVLLVAGGAGMAGAAALAAGGALAAGAGLVHIASQAANRAILQGVVPAAIFLDRSELEEDAVTRANAIVVGPGMGTDAEASAALERVLAWRGETPVVLDADALNLYQGRAEALGTALAGQPAVLTPHPRELGRLLDREVVSITVDPPGAARAAAALCGCAVLLKGQPSVVARPDGRLLVNTTGSSDLGTGGMGDHLAGTVAAFLAAGVPAAEAAALGLFYGGRAADLAGGGAARAPADLSAASPAALAAPGAAASTLGLPFVTFDQPPRR
ncbi:MAG: NAD(P)H-hydrate dehydratase [Gemmatimonadota bacterium]